MDDSCMRNASGHNYRNDSFILDLAMDRHHVPQNVFLVYKKIMNFTINRI